MKLLIASDIHGDLESLELVLKAFKDEDCDRLLLLGDLLYHGPRNDLPTTYAPKKVIELLNANKDYIMNVKGHCDGEVDQMVLDFPILADYILLSLDGLNVIATHGHKYSPENPMPLSKGDILLTGHTHLYANEKFGNDNLYLNPGSVSIPKGGNETTYMIYENRRFILKTFSGDTIFDISL